MAQAVSRQPLTLEVLSSILGQAISDLWVDKVALGQVFLRASVISSKLRTHVGLTRTVDEIWEPSKKQYFHLFFLRFRGTKRGRVLFVTEDVAHFETNFYHRNKCKPRGMRS